MKRLILISALAAAVTVAACSPGTDDGIGDETFPAGSLPVETVSPSDMPSVDVSPSVDASLAPTTIP
jgi:predicted small secreted protein